MRDNNGSNGAQGTLFSVPMGEDSGGKKRRKKGDKLVKCANCRCIVFLGKRGRDGCYRCGFCGEEI